MHIKAVSIMQAALALALIAAWIISVRADLSLSQRDSGASSASLMGAEGAEADAYCLHSQGDGCWPGLTAEQVAARNDR